MHIYKSGGPRQLEPLPGDGINCGCSRVARGSHVACGAAPGQQKYPGLVHASLRKSDCVALCWSVVSRAALQ